MIWGAISNKGKSEISIKEWGVKWTQENYIDNLETNLIPFADSNYEKNEEWILLQDNAPIHKGKKTLSWLEESQIQLVRHPPYSPDLNPIEFIWKLMKDFVEKKSPENLSQLKERIKEAWDAITQDQINGCIDYLKKRMTEAYTTNGDFI
jgi:transposase